MLEKKSMYALSRKKRLKALSLLKTYISKGLVIIPKICDECESRGVLKPNHIDYSEPLKVSWLCSECSQIFTFRNKREYITCKTCSFKYKYTDICMFCADESKKIKKDVRANRVKDFLDEYIFHDDRDIALLVATCSSTKGVKSFFKYPSQELEDKIEEIHARFKYFMKHN